MSWTSTFVVHSRDLTHAPSSTHTHRPFSAPASPFVHRARASLSQRRSGLLLNKGNRTSNAEAPLHPLLELDTGLSHPLLGIFVGQPQALRPPHSMLHPSLPLHPLPQLEPSIPGPPSTPSPPFSQPAMTPKDDIEQTSELAGKLP